MIVAFEVVTSSLLVAVFDGHGQNGHKVKPPLHPSELFDLSSGSVSPLGRATHMCVCVGPQVSGFFQQHFPKRLFTDKRFPLHPCEAMCDAVIAIEDLLVRGAGFLPLPSSILA
jgi:hypothetical protein